VNVFIRLILIGLVGLPQGWCCVVQVGDSCCKAPNSANTEPKTSDCACCKHLVPDSCLANPSNEKEGRTPGSCECHCRFQIARPTAPSNLDFVAAESNLFEPFRMDALSRSEVVVSHVPFFAKVALHILHCSWQC